MGSVDLYLVVDTTHYITDRRFISEGWLYYIDSAIKATFREMSQSEMNVNAAILSMGNHSRGAQWVGSSLPTPLSRFPFYGMPTGSPTGSASINPNVSGALNALNRALLARPSQDTPVFIVYLLGSGLLTDYRNELMKIHLNPAFKSAMKTAFSLTQSFPKKDPALLAGSVRHVCTCHSGAAFSAMFHSLLTTGCRQLLEGAPVDSAATLRQALSAAGLTPSVNTLSLSEISSPDHDITISEFLEGLDFKFIHSLDQQIVQEYLALSNEVAEEAAKPKPAPVQPTPSPRPVPPRPPVERIPLQREVPRKKSLLEKLWPFGKKN